MSSSGLLVISLAVDSRRRVLQGDWKWGGAQISEKHAGFIVNVDHATATDYVELIAHIQQVIKERFDVQLETEVRIIGEEAKIIQHVRNCDNV